MSQKANTVDQKIIERLQKLLALAASDNEHEAQLAMGKAEELMREHNLSVADVALNGSGAYVQSQVIYGLTLTTQKWERNLGWNVARAFGGRAIHVPRNGDIGWYFTMVAGCTDLVIIVDLYERLRETMKRMTRLYVKRHYYPGCGTTRSRLQNSYILGLLDTVILRLRRLKENTAPTDQKNAYGLTGKELVVVKGKAIDKRVGELFQDLKTIRSRSSKVVTSAYQQGQADGHNVSLHRSVDGNSAPAAIGL